MNNKILVIGDTILDEYIYIEPKKISDEAHVITSEIDQIKYNLGGGANVARNIVSQGSKCTYIGVVSLEKKNIIESEMKFYNINYKLFVVDDCTQIKTRIISNRGSQICRYDTKINPVIPHSIKKKIEDYILQNIYKFDFVVISKYYDFFIDENLSQKIIKECKKNKIKLIIDNRQSNAIWFKGADFYKVNFNEFKALFSIVETKNDITSIKKILMSRKIPFSNLIITRSNLPTILFNSKSKKIIEIPVSEVKVKDVSGAGDTFVSAFSINYNDKENIINVIKKCHDICNIVVKKLGTDVVWLFESDSDFDLKTLSKQLKMNSKKIVLTNGVFDILHDGHIKLLKEAKSLGDYLLVAINSDQSVRKIKGDNRPIKSENVRKKILESISFVDKVIVFNETTVDSILEEVQPDFYVKGADYTKNMIPEKESLKYAKKVIFIDMVKGKSSSNYIDKIRVKNNEN